MKVNLNFSEISHHAMSVFIIVDFNLHFLCTLHYTLHSYELSHLAQHM